MKRMLAKIAMLLVAFTVLAGCTAFPPAQSTTGDPFKDDRIGASNTS